MNVIVQSKSLPVTESLRAFVERQAKKLTRQGMNITSVSVFLEYLSGRKNETDAAQVRFCISVPGKTMCVRRQANDMYEAIIDAAQRSARTVRKMKEKRRARRRRSPDVQVVAPQIGFAY